MFITPPEEVTGLPINLSCISHIEFKPKYRGPNATYYIRQQVAIYVPNPESLPKEEDYMEDYPPQILFYSFTDTPIVWTASSLNLDLKPTYDQIVAGTYQLPQRSL